jgi:hypothetical protein
LRIFHIKTTPIGLEKVLFYVTALLVFPENQSFLYLVSEIKLLVILFLIFLVLLDHDVPFLTQFLSSFRKLDRCPSTSAITTHLPIVELRKLIFSMFCQVNLFLDRGGVEALLQDWLQFCFNFCG